MYQQNNLTTLFYEECAYTSGTKTNIIKKDSTITKEKISSDRFNNMMKSFLIKKIYAIRRFCKNLDKKYPELLKNE